MPKSLDYVILLQDEILIVVSAWEKVENKFLIRKLVHYTFDKNRKGGQFQGDRLFTFVLVNIWGLDLTIILCGFFFGSPNGTKAPGRT